MPEGKAELITPNTAGKKEDARERWKLLAKALSSPKRPQRSRSSRPSVSVRRFDSFGLVVPEILENQSEGLEDYWLKYSAKVGERTISVDICLLRQQLTATELMGFNNTGNVCVWPSEEVLAWYLLPRVSLFADKSILELGGGMTCLAGVLLARYSQASAIHLTDGNRLSVENVRRIVEKNGLRRTVVSQLDWKDYTDIRDKYDVVLCADCLFFDETRRLLVEALWHCLAGGGVVLVMAPPRGGTLHEFMEVARARGFSCSLHPRYCDAVWLRHLNFMKTCSEYDQDLHYPILLLLIKSEYWVSQKRKFCDFCKCSIADNKPSVQFHENGKKHKENVQKRLSEMQKKASKDASNAATVSRQMKRMEEAAMKAYLKDIEANPDYTSQKIKETLESATVALTVPENPVPDKPEATARPVKEKKWMEAKTAEDYTYYWNVDTGESIWAPPKGGFVSLEDQNKVKEEAEPKAPAENKALVKKEKNVSDLNREIYGSASNSRVVGPVKEEPSEHTDEGGVSIGPSPRYQPYGTWTSVVKQEQPEPDLQLPQQPPVEIDIPSIPMPQEKTKLFKERKAPVVTNSSGDANVPFKKRKLGGVRNARQRAVDD